MPLLRRFGPPEERAGEPERAGLEESLAYARELTTSHYENFSVLSRLVPERVRPDVAAIYAYCRWSDDLADETGSDEAARTRSLRLLSWWRGELESCHRSASDPEREPPSHPVFVALRETIRTHRLPIEPFSHLLDAFEQDQRVTRYETWDELVAYCTGSADPVGRLVLALAGHEPAKAPLPRGTPAPEQDPGGLIAMSDATCTALQLTNFWQDVRRDLVERDRVYLPSREFLDTEPDELAGTLRVWLDRPNDPAVRVPFIKAMRPLSARTQALFDSGSALPKTMRAHRLGDFAPMVGLFAAGGRSVLAIVESIGGATLWRRPTLSKPRKALLLLNATIGGMTTRRANTP
ncbi:MAG: squalene/phytoene synthase family protein [Planctomycetota bacterium]